jgi:hypothetical protein
MNRLTLTFSTTPRAGELLMTLKTLAVAIVIVAAACIAAACGDTAHASAAEAPSTESRPVCAPVKVALIVDKSKSAPGTRTPALSIDEVDSLVEVVASCGGELAFGVIHDRITDPFVRLRLDARPQKPADSTAHNVILRRREQSALTRSYAENLKRWEDNATAKVGAFGQRVKPLLEHAADANWSPVWDSVARGDLFLAERESGPDEDARRVLILVSDAVDDVRGAPAQRRAALQSLKSGATLLIVNGAGSAGSLAGLKPVSFESFEPAVRYVEQLTETAHATAVASATNNQ